MADIRTLKLALLADTKDFISGLDKADKETRTFSDKLGKALKTGALAFAALGAAAGAAAITIGVQAVKAAIEDEKAQLTLAKTLENTTKATKNQIKSVEDYIKATSLAKGVTDDQLRPSLDRLVRSTGDVTKAQKLQQLALDISAGTGKDLASVSEALGKAYDGNLGALKRLGVPLDDSIVKSKDFTKAQEALTKQFAGQSDVAANSFAGRMERVKIAIDEAKESIGAALLPILEKLLGFITEKALPFLNNFVAGFENVTKSVNIDLGGALEYLQSIFTPIFNGIQAAFKTVSDAIDRNREKLQPLFDLFKGIAAFVKDILIPVLAIGLGEAFKIIGSIIGGIIDVIAIMVDAIAKAVQTIQGLIDKIQEYINKANSMPIIGSLIPDSLATQKTSTTNINLTVKGGVPDKVATARTMTQVLNQTQKTTGLRAFA
jgi:phage-related protein